MCVTGRPGWRIGLQFPPSQATRHPRRPLSLRSRSVPGTRRSRPRRLPATSSGCLGGSPPKTRAAPTPARTPAPAPGLGSPGSSATRRTRRGAELPGGSRPGPARSQPAVLTIPAVHFGGPGHHEGRTRPGPQISRSRASSPAAPHVTWLHVTMSHVT